jgi:aromatic-amino-acid transaminase
MLSNLTAQPQDKILALMAAYRADPRETKIDLGVGVYKDATGATPVMRAIKSAEELLWKTQETKAYVGLAGDPAFSAAMIDLVSGWNSGRRSPLSRRHPWGHRGRASGA